jgi:replicative DNA helicase
VADANDHARRVLSAIVPSRRDLLDKALQQLTPTHFPDPALRNLYQLLERYAEVTGAIMTRDALEDMLRAQDVGKRALYLETYDAVSVQSVPEGDFTWSVQQLRELAAEKATNEALVEAMEILRSGASSDRGKQLRGHEDARHHVLERFSEIDRELSMQDSPEGDMRLEGGEMADDYARRKDNRLKGKAPGILFGIPDLDVHVGGLQPGELDFLVGYSSDGKTSLCVQLAWSCAVEQGRNVVFLTTETLRSQVRRKLLSRHSKLPQFGLPDGLKSSAVKSGTLSDEEERVLTQEVIPDFASNPTYGRCYIAQVPRGANMAAMESRLYRVARMFRVDLVVMDYLRLLRAPVHRQSEREELGAMIIEAKQLSTTFDDGRGVPFVSPWQVNRSSWEEANRAGYYTLKCLAESAEATNSADVIVSVLAPQDREGRRAEVKCQVLKNRDGEQVPSIPVDVDYATSCFTSRNRNTELDGLIETPGMAGQEEFAGLLGG